MENSFFIFSNLCTFTLPANQLCPLCWNGRSSSVPYLHLPVDHALVFRFDRRSIIHAVLSSTEEWVVEGNDLTDNVVVILIKAQTHLYHWCINRYGDTWSGLTTVSVDVFYSEVSGRLVWSHGKAKGADVGHPRSTQSKDGSFMIRVYYCIFFMLF